VRVATSPLGEAAHEFPGKPLGKLSVGRSEPAIQPKLAEFLREILLRLHVGDQCLARGDGGGAEIQGVYSGQQAGIPEAQLITRATELLEHIG